MDKTKIRVKKRQPVQNKWPFYSGRKTLLFLYKRKAQAIGATVCADGAARPRDEDFLKVTLALDDLAHGFQLDARNAGMADDNAVKVDVFDFCKARLNILQLNGLDFAPVFTDEFQHAPLHVNTWVNAQHVCAKGRECGATPAFS